MKIYNNVYDSWMKNVYNKINFNNPSIYIFILIAFININNLLQYAFCELNVYCGGVYLYIFI